MPGCSDRRNCSVNPNELRRDRPDSDCEPLQARGIASNPQLDETMMMMMLAAPDTGRWIGRRDHALLLVAVQTGLRVSELTGLCCRDVDLGTGPTCAVSARDANSAARRSPPRRSRCCGPGWPNDEADPRIRCSRLAAVGRSVVTRSRCSSPTTRSRRGSAALRPTPRRSPRTSCVTRPR
jgi:hypothetical protein